MRSPRKAETLRLVVERLLNDCGVINPPVPVTLIAQNLGAEIRYSPFDGNLAGMLVRREGSPSVIGVNSSHHINRQRFTIAHECGHLCLHKGKDVYIDRGFPVVVNRRDELSTQAIDPDEIEANRFAAELLIPYNMILNDTDGFDIEEDEDLNKLGDRYQVSIQALTYRINNLAIA